MRNRLLTVASLSAATALAAGPALSQTATTQFGVQITINAECLVNSATDMDFGTVGVINTALEATSTIAVQCTGSIPYDIGLSNGLNGTAPETRLMLGPDGETVEYSLYTDPARTDVWGDVDGAASTITGTGTGSEETFTVHGLVPVQPTPGPGAYTDTVTVTVSY